MRKETFSCKTAVEILLIYLWCTNLTATDSFFSLYILCSVAGLICILENKGMQCGFSAGVKTILVLAASAFSVSVVLANYTLFQPYGVLLNALNLIICLTGGYILGWNVLVCLVSYFPLRVKQETYSHPGIFFTAVFVIMCVINLTYLFVCKYPGVAPYDSVFQFSQAMGLSPYSNWTPYWHTKTIEFFYRFGFAVFGDVNAAVACFAAFQAVFAAGCFAYALVTLYQMGMPKFVLAGAFFLYALLPYNIAFSVCMGKDQLFGLGLLLMLTALVRVLLGVGKSKLLNGVVLACGALGYSLWRTNGLPTFLVFVILASVFLWKSNKNTLGILAAVAIVAWYLTNPYLNARMVPDGSITETLAVPLQQIARVVVKERDLTADETASLAEIFYLDQMAELYTPMRVDPIKFDAFRHSRYDYFRENLGDYAKLWIKLGLRYPMDYLEAWIDQTKGFWHGGYDMGVYDREFPDNTLGIYNTPGDNILSKAILLYFRLFERPDWLQFLKSIGFVVWGIFACFVVVLAKRRNLSVVFALPVIMLVLFWVGTPVFAEFRYAYPLFVVSPLLMAVTVAEPAAE